MITSDKCYENVEWVYGYRETDALGCKDPYSASKAAAEMAIRAWSQSFFSSPDSLDVYWPYARQRDRRRRLGNCADRARRHARMVDQAGRDHSKPERDTALATCS